MGRFASLPMQEKNDGICGKFSSNTSVTLSNLQSIESSASCEENTPEMLMSDKNFRNDVPKRRRKLRHVFGERRQNSRNTKKMVHRKKPIEGKGSISEFYVRI